jgi:membrane fusion protein (multidrug efflux system)
MKTCSPLTGIVRDRLALAAAFHRIALGVACLMALASWAAETRCPGIIKPYLDVTLSASVPGIVTSRKFAEGTFVQEGAVLLELDSNLERLEAARRKVLREQKQTDFEATQKLFKTTKGTSKEELDKKEAEYKVAALEHDIAVEQLRRRQVIAPLSGVIAEIWPEVGEACQPYQPLMRVVDRRRCYLVTNVEARLGSRLNLGQQLMIEVETGGAKVTLPGKIVFLSPVVDPASSLRKVKVLFENKEDNVLPGLTGIMLCDTGV